MNREPRRILSRRSGFSDETPVQCVLLDYRMPQMDGSGSGLQSERAARETVLRKLIIKALDKTHFNVSQAAELLGVSRQSLFPT